MSRDARIYLEDILLACQKIRRYIAGASFVQFVQDDRTFDAVIRNLEIIGEAAKSIPPETQQRFPEVEWRAASAFRNILAHQYFAIKEEIVWDIVQNKIPPLQEQIEQALLELD
jgi:uncharacterized protein with HEPN domain